MTEPIGVYIETAALFAVMSDDRAHAERLVGNLSLTEAETFAGQLRDLRNLLVTKIVADREALRAVARAFSAESARTPQAALSAAVDMTEASSGFTMPDGWTLEYDPATTSGKAAGWYLYGPGWLDGDWLGTTDTLMAHARAMEQIAAFEGAAAESARAAGQTGGAV